VSDSLRQGWGRGSATLQVPPAALGVLAAELFDGAAVTAVETLSGGLANTNIRLDLDRAPGRVVLRLAQRDPAALGREAALLRLAASRGIPAAVLLHAETDATRLGAPFLLLGFVEGVMLEAALGPTIPRSPISAMLSVNCLPRSMGSASKRPVSLIPSLPSPRRSMRVARG
jgi:aminoglycoside phosphotransferase (APT) family kinase protein